MLLIMTTEMKAKRKPLSFSTTMRNPDRIAGFLNQMKPYENQTLTSEVIYKIIFGVIKNKLYKTNYEIGNPVYKYVLYGLSIFGFVSQSVQSSNLSYSA